jgi:hypothetical protein
MLEYRWCEKGRPIVRLVLANQLIGGGQKAEKTAYKRLLFKLYFIYTTSL